MRRMATMLLWWATIPAYAGSGATAELQLGYTLAHQRAQLAEAGLEELTSRLAELEELLRNQGLGEPGGVQTAEQVAAELGRVRGKVEELEFAVRDIRADLDQYLMDQERRQLHDEARLAQLEELLAVQPPVPPSLDGSDLPTDEGDPGDADEGTEEGVEDTSDEPVTAEVPEDIQGRLDLAKARIEEGKQAAARVMLQRVQEDAPDDPLAPEIQYRLAETWFNEGKFKEAARAFQVVTDRHARSPWAPWAMLRIGECFAGMGRDDAANTFYEGVVRNYPNSDAAKDAKSALGK